jgi:Beta-galactosidase jelly roll domain
VKQFVIYSFAFFLTSISAFSQEVNLNGSWKFQVGDNKLWAESSFDDSHWESIAVPAAWEDEGFNGYDGFAWYRKKFDGRKLTKDEAYYLNLGFIDDCDEVYLNGKLIGLSGSMPPKFKTAYNNERKYTLSPEAINFEGENILAIRVFDVIHGGGIIEGRLGIYRAPKSRMLVDLQGLWQFYRAWDEEMPKSEKDWKKIMVPSPWEHQGYPKYDGNAWYKRTFTVSDKVFDTNEELVLLLGKIDDFDKAFLNGKQIGKTSDEREYGSSRSYEKLRVYAIPKTLLKKGVNTIEVFVEDLGNIGGIYEGPIGITTVSAYERYFRSNNNFFWNNE